MFYQIFLPPQVKRSAIISNKHGMSKLTEVDVSGAAASK